MKITASKLFEQFEKHLSNNLALVVICGSSKQNNLVASDIDCLIIVNSLDRDASAALCASRNEIEIAYNAPCSTTVITKDDVADIHNRYLHLDGKAVQCLIEATGDSTSSGYKSSTFSIPRLTHKQIKEYSFNNYWIIRSLLIKTLTRASPSMTITEQNKLCKIGLIANKMARQYNGNQQKELVEELSEIKNSQIVIPQRHLHSLILECTRLVTV